MSAIAPAKIRILGWGLAIGLLALPWLAMQFSTQIVWTGSDFLLFGALLASAGAVLELAAMRSAPLAWRAGMAIAAATGFVLVWANGAVGIIGAEDDPANRLLMAVPLVAVAGAALARLRAAGMAVAMVATALFQIAATFVAATPGSVPAFAFTALLVAGWLSAAIAFRRAV
jgi:hypothetical protein